MVYSYRAITLPYLSALVKFYFHGTKRPSPATRMQPILDSISP